MGSNEEKMLCYCSEVDFSGIRTLLHYVPFLVSIYTKCKRPALLAKAIYINSAH